LEPPLLPVPEPPQKPQLQVSARGRIHILEWRAWSAYSQLDGERPYIPYSYKDAINCPDAEKWILAIIDEYDSLMENKTWSIMTCPKGRHPVKFRWVFDIKPAVQGQPPRYKVRFVAKGFSQRAGVDFTETYSYVVTHDTLRLLMSCIAANDMEMVQMDIKTAFLYGSIEEEIYMTQPECFVIPGRETEVCQLHRCIYGLKQSSYVWGKPFTDFIKKHGFIQSKEDPCLF
jgi:hypothetical protein